MARGKQTISGQQVGYIRVSSIAQSTARQLEGINLDKKFEDKVSGKDTNRPKLNDCIDWLREGDTLHVHSIDRLARNLVDLQQLITEITDKKKASIQFHKENLLFTPDATDSMQTLMLQMMGAFAQFERELIKERQREGIALAKKAGKHLGRSRSLSVEQVEEIARRAAAGESKSQLAKEFNVSRQTLYSSLAQLA